MDIKKTAILAISISFIAIQAQAQEYVFQFHNNSIASHTTPDEGTGGGSGDGSTGGSEDPLNPDDGEDETVRNVVQNKNYNGSLLFYSDESYDLVENYIKTNKGIDFNDLFGYIYGVPDVYSTGVNTELQNNDTVINVTNMNDNPYYWPVSGYFLDEKYDGTNSVTIRTLTVNNDGNYVEQYSKVVEINGARELYFGFPDAFDDEKSFKTITLNSVSLKDTTD